MPRRGKPSATPKKNLKDEGKEVHSAKRLILDATEKLRLLTTPHMAKVTAEFFEKARDQMQTKLAEPWLESDENKDLKSSFELLVKNIEVVLPFVSAMDPGSEKSLQLVPLMQDATANGAAIDEDHVHALVLLRTMKACGDRRDFESAVVLINPKDHLENAEGVGSDEYTVAQVKDGDRRRACQASCVLEMLLSFKVDDKEHLSKLLRQVGICGILDDSLQSLLADLTTTLASRAKETDLDKLKIVIENLQKRQNLLKPFLKSPLRVIDCCHGRIRPCCSVGGQSRG